MKQNNPFITEGYIGREYFCDRKDEVADMLAALRSRRNMTVYSPRRMGKTGLIHRTFDDCLEAKCYYIDIMHTACLKDFVSLLATEIIGSLDGPVDKLLKKVGDISRHLRPVISADTYTGAPSLTVTVQPDEEQPTLKEIFDYLAHYDHPCYIAIDEFQAINDYPEQNVEALLRSYIQFLPNCTFIFSGSKKHLMQEMFSSPKRPFYQSTQSMSLQAINRDAYADFATNFFSQVGCMLPRECFYHIYDSVHGHTWYIQYWLSKLYEMKEKQIDMSLVNLTLKKIMGEEEDNYLTYMRLLTPAQRKIITAIAKEGRISQPLASSFTSKYQLPAISTIRSSLAKLIEDDLVLFDHNDYSVYNRFFMIWLSQRGV